METPGKKNSLRERAEDFLRNKGTLNSQELPKDYLELIEGFQIQQFELEIQNEELIRLQQSLEKSKSRFEKLFNNAPVPYCILNLQGVIQDANHAFLSLLGTTSNESNGKNLNQFVDHQSQDDFYLHLRKATSITEGYTSTMIFNSAAGKAHVKLHSQLEQLEVDEEIVLLCTLNNITNEINFQNELLLSEERFRSLVTSLDDVVFTLDTDQRHTGVYGKWLERFNQTPNDYLGKTAEDLFGKELASIHQENNTIALAGKNVVYEWHVDNVQGKQYLQTSLSPMFNSSNQVVGIAGVARNITELKRAQLALKERHKELNCLYTVTSLGNDTNLMLPDYIEECVEIIPSGFTNPADTVIRIQIGDEVFQSKGFLKTSFSISSDILIDNEVVGSIDVYCLIQNCLETEEHFGPEERGLLNAIANHLSRIIKRNYDSDEISQQYVSLQKLNAEKDKLFSVIGHDLRGSLSTILGIGSVLEQKEGKISKEKRISLIQGINKTAINVYQLLENLLEWARLQRGDILFSPEKNNLQDMISRVTEFYEQQCKVKRISIISDINPELEIWVDGNMVNSIFRNLLSNAIKFTRFDGEIRISAQKNEDAMVEIAIADNGIGMNEEMLNSLFRIECNIGREGTNNEPSSGLGLLLCKEFVEKNNGTIWAESTEGKGSTFFVALPKS